METIFKFLKQKMSSGKSIIEIATFDNYSTWWFVDFAFNQYINTDIKYCSQKYFLVDTQNIILNMKLYLYSSSEFFLDWVTKVILGIFIKLQKQRTEKKIHKNERNVKIIFTSQDLQWRKLNGNTNENFSKKTDVFFDTIITKLTGKGYECIGVHPIAHTVFSWKVFIDKIINWRVQHLPFGLFWNSKVWKKEREASNYFKEQWKYLENDDLFNELCAFKNKNNSQKIKQKIKYYFNRLFPYAVKCIEIAKNMIETEKPDLILLLYEYGYFGRCLIFAANMKKIPVIAIQHGVIHKHHKGYIYPTEYISKTGSVCSPFCPIPNITAVYGSYHKDLLTTYSAYPKEKIVVTGQPRYDVLFNMDGKYSKEKFISKYNINSKNKIILWTTQCHVISDKENKNNFKAMFETLQNLKDVTLIIKQHPGEGKKYTKMIKAALKDYNLNIVITSKSSDIYEQLYVCDVMVTKNSTTAMEAVALNKPVIVLNLSGETDVIGYVTEGVALGVYNERDLTPTIEKLLKDDSKLAENRDQYIEKYLYKIDGKSTERIVQLIEKTLDEWEK